MVIICYTNVILGKLNKPKKCKNRIKNVTTMKGDFFYFSIREGCRKIKKCIHSTK